MPFADKLNLAFKLYTKPDGSEYKPEDIERETSEITASYIWRLRSGKATNPTIRVVQTLSDFFKISPSFFFEETHETKPGKAIALRALTENAIEEEFLSDMLLLIHKLRQEYLDKKESEE